MATMVRLICPNLKCRAILSVPTATRGKTVKCRQCGVRITVPRTEISTEPIKQANDGDAATDAA